MKRVLAGLAFGLAAIFPSAQARAEETTLFARYGLRVFVDDDFRLACSGCRRGRGPAEARVVISRELGAGVTPEGQIGDILLLREDMGRSCLAGRWYALNLDTLRLLRINTTGCSEIRRVELSGQPAGPVVVNLVNFENRRTTTTLNGR